jgi:F0F1-type ATP synthase epsilon subunit
MRSSLWLIGAVAAGFMLGFITVSTGTRVAFGPSSAVAQDDNSEYEAEQARQRDENAQEQNEAQREEEEQRHQEEMDSLNSEREEQQQN